VVAAAEWGWTTVGDQFEIQLGKMLDAARNAGTPKPYLSNRNIRWGAIDVEALPMVPMSAADLLLYRLQPGDLLICEGGEIGRAAIWAGGLEECYYQKALHRLRPRGTYEPRLLQHYLLYWAGTGFLQAYVTGTGIPHLPKEKLAVIPLPLPSAKEQQAIAEALSDADAAIEALDALIAKKRDVKQAAMQQLLTGRTRLPGFSDDWREVQVGDVALVDPEALGMSTPADYAFRYISLENTFRGRLLGWSEERFGTAPSRARRVLRSGDFLFATVRPNLLGHHLFLRSEPDWVCSTGFSVLRSRPEICGAPFFAQHFFSQRIISQVELLISGSNYPAINSRDVSRLRLTVPCLQEQGAIAEVLSDMDSEIEALVAERDKMRLVKQGMMQELLSGRVRLV
jgi:type I restriction enzyme S subunit